MDQVNLAVRKDRKLLRKIDQNAAHNSVNAILVSLVVFVFAATWGGFYQHYQELVLTFGSVLLLITAYRLSLIARFESMYGRGPGRWRRLFSAGMVSHAAVWGCFAAALLQFDGLKTNFLVTLIFLVGVCSALSSAWMSSNRSRKFFLLLSFTPSIGVLLLHGFAGGHFDELVVAGLVFIYTLYLYRLYDAQYVAYWRGEMRARKLQDSAVSQDAPLRSHQDIQLSLVYRLAHEIRTPMNSVLGMLSLLEETDLTDEQKEYELVASQSGRLLLTVIDDVLDYTRILTGKINLQPDYFDLRASLEQSVDALGLVAQRKGLELTCVVERHMPWRLRGDRERIMQIITNLITNAIKFSDKGEIRLDASLTPLDNDEGLLVVSVTDQGCGIEPHARETLFDDPFLGPEANTLQAQESGFGLLVCKGLAEAMDGEIGVESEPGQGSRFWFTARVRVQESMSVEDPLARALSDKNILIVGAASGTAQALREELTDLGASLQETADYDHALQALRDVHREGGTPLDLLFIDVWSRCTSALNLCRAISEDTAISGTPMVLLTSLQERSSAQVQNVLTHLDRLDVLSKPLTRSGVRNVLHKHFDVEKLHVASDQREGSQADRQQRKHYRLLLVEDNEVNQIVTKGMLDKLGYKVKCVADGEEALSLLAQESFDLILMDCLMPRMDGYDATRAIRQKEQGTGRRVPVIAMTASTMEGVQSKCMAAGMDDYLAKPVHIDQLEGALQHWLNSNKYTAPDPVDPES